ncbi:MAG: anthranilate synthase component I family protein [Bradymonadaceae bacterium]
MKTAVFEGAPALEVVRRLAVADPGGGVLFFDSGTSADGTDRWSIVCAFPDEILVEAQGVFRSTKAQTVVDDPLAWIRERQRRHHPHDFNSLGLPFHGGLAGMLSFELAWMLDDIRAEHAPSAAPGLWVADFPTAAVYSHARKRWYIVGEKDDSRHEAFREAITATTAPDPSPTIGDDIGPPARWLKISREAYERGVQACIDAISGGELFEVNYTERFEAPWEQNGFALFESLRAVSNGDFGGYLQAPGLCVASISPEQFIRVDQGHVTTRPIKGTRRRSQDPSEDDALARGLLHSPKDRAENVMIVDLMRNDLTRFCRPGSVEVTSLCALESFAGVHHLVSRVEGELDPSLDALDALMTSFPAGSITGAPKLRSIELISEFEHDARGAYTGSFFYWSRCGRLDSNVLIRTATLANGRATYGAGGAVVADSVPGDEFDEALLKARPFTRAMNLVRP